MRMPRAAIDGLTLVLFVEPPSVHGLRAGVRACGSLGWAYPKMTLSAAETTTSRAANYPAHTHSS